MNAHVQAMADKAKTLADGIYFGLPEESYHADPALGSTSLKSLVDNAPDFWWESWMNPNREPDTDTPAKAFGRAVHKCVLEGRKAFQEVYAPLPEAEDYPGCLRTMDDLKAFLKGRELATTAKSKADLIERAVAVEDCPPIFDVIMDRFEKAGKKPLKRDEYNRILSASDFIRANTNLRAAFEGGYPEVSVFWTVDGIRFKVRFDYLKMRAIADLKSIRNPMNKPFDRACRERIAAHDHMISAAHYSEGRRQMSRLVKLGAVYGAPEENPDFMPWLINVANNPSFAFVLVFWQADGAPISTGFQLSPANPLLDYARASIRKAVANYQHFMTEFGPDKPWVPSPPLEELQETDLPVWFQQKLIGG